MINFLLTEAAGANNAATKYIMTGLLIVVLIGMLVMPYMTQKKKNTEYMNMLNSIKAGDLVKTAGGIIGRIMKIIDKGEIKTVILETGSKTEKSYIELDMNMIYCVLTSSKVQNTENTENATEDDEEDEDLDEGQAVETENAEKIGEEQAVETVETPVVETPEIPAVEEETPAVETEVKEEQTKENTQKTNSNQNKKVIVKKTNNKNSSKKSNSKKK